MKLPFNPDKEVRDYCDHIMHAHIQVLRENKDERTWYWDYPAVAAVCHNDTCMAKRSSFSHYPSGGKPSISFGYGFKYKNEYKMNHLCLNNILQDYDNN